MGYFSNGTEGELFIEKYCYHCKNWRDLKDGRGFGCPIMDIHFLYSYELCNSKSIGKKMLDFLISGYSEGQKCSMFLSKRTNK